MRTGEQSQNRANSGPRGRGGAQSELPGRSAAGRRESLGGSGTRGCAREARYLQRRRGLEAGPAKDASAKTRGFHTQLDEGPETP